jgi:hypothetical protein
MVFLDHEKVFNLQFFKYVTCPSIITDLDHFVIKKMVWDFFSDIKLPVNYETR